MTRLKYLFVLLVIALATAAEPKEKVIILSWGDLVGDHSGDKRFDGAVKVEDASSMTTLAKLWKARGVEKVLFRVDDWRYLQFMAYHMPEDEPYRVAVVKAWNSGLLEKAVAAVRGVGVKMYMWISVIDEGCPPSIM